MRTLARLCLCLLAVAAGSTACRERPAPAPSDPAAAPGAPAASPGEPAPSVTDAPRPPDPAPVRELVVHDLTPPPTRVVDLSDEVEDIVRDSLAETRRLSLPAEGGSPADDGYSLGFGVLYQLVVDEERPATKPEKGTLYVLVEADMGRRRAGALPEAYDARAVRQLPYDPATDGALEPLLRGQVERAVDETRGRLVATLRLAGGSDDAVLAMLRDEDPLVRAAAAREAGERRLAGAVEPLERALDAEEAELRLAALGALGRIGDARAVPAVVRRTQGMDVDEIRAAVFALGDIGGPEARRYLETMAYGHPDPAIQDAAKAALAGAAGR